MADYSIGEIERITGLKSHVLRYWEEALPLIRPRKDDQGRRVYGERDLELIRRLQHLVQEEKYTLEGAGERLIKELTSVPLNDAHEEIRAIRDRLTDALQAVRRLGTHTDNKERQND